ncbi:putative fructosyl amino acid protein [Xylariales sp. PMI_506]|nr:putative fructosyl amino acid protein [Xylariales sp. PMI_506]
MVDPFRPPSSLLIVGTGVFGLSTAYALSKRSAWSSTQITIVDRAPEPTSFLSPDASSIDSSRIVRNDYADPAYTALGAAALREWRKPGSWGADGRYTETGFLLVADQAPERRPDGIKTGMGYTRASYLNAIELEKREGSRSGSLEELSSPKAIGGATPSGGQFGDWGYINRRSGWADAEATMKWLYERVVSETSVKFVRGTVERLLVDGRKVRGAKLQDGSELEAELVLVAAGAWTPSLVDLRGQAVATGQVLAYTNLTAEEQGKLANAPVMMSMTHSTFIITPRDQILKIGRHAYGYQNPTKVNTALVVPKDEGDSVYSEITVSQPYTHLNDKNLWIPADGERDLREGLRRMVPWPEVYNRPWTNSRICWYTDTATGDFLITYHPYWDGLFLATGGSGHGFKFLPVLGDKIADTVEKNCPSEFREAWGWRAATDVEKAIVTEDGSRSGRLGQILKEELNKVPARL